jgi:hypothetical protein
MTTLRAGLFLTSILLAFGCGKKDEKSAGGAPAASKSGLPWTPDGYDKMSATCKKALACCEEVAKSEGAKSPEDFNLKCSGPATWKDGECDLDMKGRVTVFESGGKPVPDACK